MNRKQLAALDAAGAALRDLNLGAVRLRYRPADLLAPESYSLWIDAGPHTPDIVGVGPTPQSALFDALAKRDGNEEAA